MSIFKNFKKYRDFPGGPVINNPLENAGNIVSIPGPRRSLTPRGN